MPVCHRHDVIAKAVSLEHGIVDSRLADKLGSPKYCYPCQWQTTSPGCDDILSVRLIAQDLIQKYLGEEA